MMTAGDAGGLPGFEFATATRIIFGAGKAAELPALTTAFGKRILLVTGSDPRRFSKIVAALEAVSVTLEFFPISGEPSVPTIEDATRLARDWSIDVIVAIGGGSAIDAGKAIAALAANEGDPLDYLEVVGKGNPLTKEPLPFIAVPTTSGTGAEVTRNAVLSVPEARVKVSLRSPHMLPNVALIDPKLTYDLPAGPTATTGMDALTQLIEPYLCNRANPMTDALCVEGIQRAARALPVVVREPGNASARVDMSVASLFGGLALANAGLGAVHGFAGPIGGMFPAPHGAVCAALLPHVLRANLDALRFRDAGNPILARFDTVARLLTGNPDAGADDAVDRCRSLAASLNIPGLSSWGITENDVDEIVSKAAKASSMKANPVVLTAEELATTLRAALA